MLPNHPQNPNPLRRWIAVALSLSFLLSAGWWLSAPENTSKLGDWVGPIQIPEKAESGGDNGEQRLQTALQRIQRFYIEDINQDSLYDEAIRGLLEQIGDPHSSLLSPQEYKELTTRTRGDFGGLGFQVDIHQNHPVVITPLPGTPAQKAGLKAGDLIVAVEGTSTDGWTVEEAVQRLRGKVGTSVQITVERPGREQQLTFDITRQKIKVESVEASYMLGPDLGYMELVSFQQTSGQEIRQTLESFQKQAEGRLDGVVLDLRRNPGGLLDVAVNLADIFLPRGTEIAQTRGRASRQNEIYEAQKKASWQDLEIVILVGPASASGSEVLAGALQDHDRGLIMGLPTFGKGSVQSLFPLPDQYYLKLTTALWYTPLGRSLQRPRKLTQQAQEANIEENPFGGPLPEHLTESRRDTFYTDAGRPVYGGGGIHPDLTVADSVRMIASEFIEKLEPHSSTYTEIEYELALEYLQDHPELERSFTVEPAVLDSLEARLRNAGVKIHPDLYEEAQTWMSRSLEYEIALARWGSEAARRVLNRYDPAVRTAQEWMRAAPTQAALIERAFPDSLSGNRPRAERK